MSTVLADSFVEAPHVEWTAGRPFAFARLTSSYAALLENLALAKESAIKALPVTQGWEKVAEKNPTTARFSAYSAFLLSRDTHVLFFAVRETYLHLLRALDQGPAPRYIQCWYNVHRSGQALVRHHHVYPFIGTFSAHAEGSTTRYGSTPQRSESDVILDHVDGQLMITTGKDHFHETSVWGDPERPRVTFAFDILGVAQWNPRQVFLPFDV